MLVQVERREQEPRDRIRDLQRSNAFAAQIAKLVYVYNSHDFFRGHSWSFVVKNRLHNLSTFFRVKLSHRERDFIVSDFDLHSVFGWHTR